MEKTSVINRILVSSVAAVLLAFGQTASAHTRLEIPTINEGTSVYNNEVISHGCKNPVTGATNVDTIGTVAVFPDGTDSVISVNGQTSSTPLSDIVSGWGVRKVQSKAVFDVEAEILDANGNSTGYWAAGIPGRMGRLIGLVPFRTNAVFFSETSCAKSVKFIVAIADVCEVTDIAGFDDSTALLWTPAVGSNFDGTPELDGYDSPASLTINRTSALPAGCPVVDGDGDGIDEGDVPGDVVVVTPSAAQLNRDFPVSIDGAQVWPRP
ncbi:MAG: hypothetical protein ACU84J_12670 [Gammaproteobacteria bacterium]